MKPTIHPLRPDWKATISYDGIGCTATLFDDKSVWLFENGGARQIELIPAIPLYSSSRPAGHAYQCTLLGADQLLPLGAHLVEARETTAIVVIPPYTPAWLAIQETA